MLNYKVWLSFIFILCFLSTSCSMAQNVKDPAMTVPLEQDTLEMEPDFSYAFVKQIPHISIDSTGYRGKDKKVAFFCGNELDEYYEICDSKTGQVVYSGTLNKLREEENAILYMGNFTTFSEEGEYYIHHKQLGDSYDFVIENNLYDKQYDRLENQLLKEKYPDVNSQAYLLANYMFIHELDAEKWINESYIRAKIQLLLNSMDEETGVFCKEVREEPLDVTIETDAQNALSGTTGTESTISLSTTAQMAGVLAQYVYLYRDTEDSYFINQCLQASKKAFGYVEKYRDNTDTDAWYYAAVQLYRATRQYKYRNAIAEYDTLPVESRSSTEQGYTLLADFSYLLTPYGTDYNRCEALLMGYIDKAQYISAASSGENYFVLEQMETMSERQILEDMFIMGVINHVLSGQEYAGVQKNYIHYLSGVNKEVTDYLNESILNKEENGEIDVANASKMLVVYSNLCEEK